VSKQLRRLAVVAVHIGILAAGCGGEGAGGYPSGARAAFVDSCVDTLSGSCRPADKFCNCFYAALKDRLSYSDYKRVVRPILKGGTLPEELRDVHRDIDVECERFAPGGSDYDGAMSGLDATFGDEKPVQ
jgi:hypothetical protein